MTRFALFMLVLLLVVPARAETVPRGDFLRGTGDLGIIIERADGAVVVVDTTARQILGRIVGLGDLSHASAVYGRDGRHAYVFGRDGGLTKIDLLTQSIAKRVIQGGNSIGGAISQDGSLVAVSNYEPGGVKIFDAQSLDLVADIPTGGKVVGLVDVPGQRFAYSLYDGNAIWITDMRDPKVPTTVKFNHIGHQPYDALITPNGRHYIAGLFGEDGMAMIDLWDERPAPRRILAEYGKGDQKLPVYKMPHLEGWAVAGRLAFVPAVGHHAVLVIDMESWTQVDMIPVHGQPVFVMARPDGRQVWVNFALPDNDTVQVIDVPSRRIVKTFKPGKGVLHMEFTPRGEAVWLSVRDTDQVLVMDTERLAEITRLSVRKPSGIFFTARAGRVGL